MKSIYKDLVRCKRSKESESGDHSVERYQKSSEKSISEIGNNKIYGRGKVENNGRMVFWEAGFFFLLSKPRTLSNS